MSESSALVVSLVFPPTVGGSGALLQNVYARMTEVDVTVLSQSLEAHTDAGNVGLRVIREKLGTDDWGVLHARGFRYYLRLAAAIRRLSKSRQTIVYAARALPEGLGAFMARRAGGAPYAVWTHGEEVAYCRTSRELRFLMTAVHRGALVSIANSHHTASLLRDIGVHPRRIQVVHPGVDPKRFHPGLSGQPVRQKYRFDDTDVVLLTVGRLQRRKGHDTVISALAGLVRTHSRIRYLIVGDGGERASLESLVGEAGLHNHVVFAGAVDAAELPSFYAACDIFVMPNRVIGSDFEGFGMVFLEAAACGRAAIGGRNGGVAEAVEPNVSGILLDDERVEGLAAAIVRLADSPGLRRTLGEAGRERVLRSFTWDRAAAAAQAVHARLVAGHGRGL